MKSLRLAALLTTALCALLITTSLPSRADNGGAAPAPPEVAATAYLLMDATTQTILAQQNADMRAPPASLTKIMTSYVAAKELNAGRINLTDQVPISVHAWKAPGSRMFIQEGRTVPLEDLLRGVIIQSGNDASIAVAEFIGGSEEAFANMMNQEAAALALHSSHFKNATGLPDPEHYTTAHDLALLARALIDHYPEHYKIYSERSFVFNDIEQSNRNRLLWRDRTVDGVKTGHTEEAGYCLVASAVRDGMRLISVVMGTASEEDRIRETQKLLQYGFRYFETNTLYESGMPLKTTPVWYGERDEVSLGVPNTVHVTIPRGRYDELRAETDVARVVHAPLAAGAALGELRVMLGEEVVYRGPLVAIAEVSEAGLFKRIWHAIYLFFWGLWN